MSEVVLFPKDATKEQIERNQAAILLNAARYATLRTIALLDGEELEAVHEAMRSVQEPTLTTATFDKQVDAARAFLFAPKPPEAA